MKKTILTFLVLIFATHNIAETIASCGPSQGQSYFPYLGQFMDKNTSGWQEDKIANGKVSVTLTDKEFDIMFVDILGDINSHKEQGAKLSLQLIGGNFFSIQSTFRGQTIEIYSFWRNNEGDFKYSFNQTKGELNPIPKSMLLLGDCSMINFDWLQGYLTK